jgi:hypothetical protein
LLLIVKAMTLLPASLSPVQLYCCHQKYYNISLISYDQRAIVNKVDAI